MGNRTPDVPSRASPSTADAAPSVDERYRLLFEANPLPLWVYDLETLRILDVNEVACRKYGYSRDEFLGLTIRDIRPHGPRPSTRESGAIVSRTARSSTSRSPRTRCSTWAGAPASSARST